MSGLGFGLCLGLGFGKIRVRVRDIRGTSLGGQGYFYPSFSM